jgi:parallel beta-helix repeat protein
MRSPAVSSLLAEGLLTYCLYNLVTLGLPRTRMRRLGAFTTGLALVVFAAIVGATPAAAANVLEVPLAYPTIQAAIDAASNGDTVLVDPGTYFENIDFKGKLITVHSAQGPSVTTIDGSNLAPVVNFSSAETSAAVLQGFTIQHGNGTSTYQYMGGGVHISFASPTIIANVISSNAACAGGGGVSVYFSSPLIQDNVITGNSVTSCSGTSGGGIQIQGAASAQVIHNVITNNASDWGGGVSLFAAGTPTLRNNTVSNNTARMEGGGVYAVNQSDANIVQNVINGNSSPSGGGLYVSPPSGTRGALLVNNTISGNIANDSGVFLGGFDASVQLSNNIVTASASQPAVLCDTTYSATPPIFDHNDVFNSVGSAAAGSCANVVGGGGNISTDPRFVSSSDLHLQAASPAVDAGNNSAPSVPAMDLDGNPRICGTAVDLGAYELQRPLALTPASNLVAVEGTSFTAVLAHFVGGYGPFNASVDWGDGQTGAATISGGSVSGSHIYAEEGAYTITITASDSTGATSSGAVTESTSDAAITGTGNQLVVVEGNAFSGTLATFQDADPGGAPADYTATIDWGDQTTSSGTIATGAFGGFAVGGTHTYAEEGSYSVKVTITDGGGATATATMSATVADAAISATGTQLSEKQRTTFTATVATLTDADPGGAAADYSGSIAWGDGTTTTCPSGGCTFVRQANGTFAVSASHSYNKKGRYTVTIKLNDAGGATTQTTTTITAG